MGKWECLHLNHCSTTKELRTPTRMYDAIWCVKPNALDASGMRWKKAPPKRPPTEKPTR